MRTSTLMVRVGTLSTVAVSGLNTYIPSGSGWGLILPRVRFTPTSPGRTTVQPVSVASRHALRITCFSSECSV